MFFIMTRKSSLDQGPDTNQNWVQDSKLFSYRLQTKIPDQIIYLFNDNLNYLHVISGLAKHFSRDYKCRPTRAFTL